jgi:hypothetical protein
LRDDDCVTGGTIAAVQALLPSGVTVTETTFAVDHAPDEDVLDARDFLLGADNGGLVLALPGGGLGRAPYLLPYVDPAVRASIAASHEFSRDVWALNARTFAETNACVRDLPAAMRASFAFRDDMRLDALCLWHVERLERLLPAATPALAQRDSGEA